MIVLMRPISNRLTASSGDLACRYEVPTPQYLELNQQHTALRLALESCGVEVVLAPPVPQAAGPFVEDDILAVPTQRGIRLILLRPHNNLQGLIDAAASAVKIESIIAAPYRMYDGGDLIRAGKTIFIRQPESTVMEDGVRFVSDNLSDLGYAVVPVRVKNGVRHLSTGASYAGRVKESETVLLNPSWVDAEPFRQSGFRVETVASDDYREKWAANVIPVNGKVVIQAERPKTSAIFPSAKLVPVPWDDFVIGDDAPCGHFSCCIVWLS